MGVGLIGARRVESETTGSLPLKTGSLVLIEAGDTHEIRNTGLGLLKTVSVYMPPAYDVDAEELPHGKP